VKEIYYDCHIKSNKNKKKTVGIIGYGIQGRDHTLNLRDSGYNVRGMHIFRRRKNCIK